MAEVTEQEITIGQIMEILRLLQRQLGLTPQAGYGACLATAALLLGMSETATLETFLTDATTAFETIRDLMTDES